MLGLFKRTAGYGDKLPTVREVNQHCTTVLQWMLEKSHTCQLRTIVCLGSAARDRPAAALGMRGASRVPLDEVGGFTKADRFTVHYLPHPARRDHTGYGPTAWPLWERMAHFNDFPTRQESIAYPGCVLCCHKGKRTTPDCEDRSSQEKSQCLGAPELLPDAGLRRLCGEPRVRRSDMR